MIPSDTHLEIGSFIFEGMDQIDLTGPFEVLSRIPNTTYRLYGRTIEPVRDIRGLRLIPDATLAAAPPLDVLHVPGGYGKEALMKDENVLGWIRQQGEGARAVFSVCTGALLCGAAGLLKGRSGNDALGIVPPAGVLRRHPCERARGRGRRLGVRGRRHGGDRRRAPSRRRAARRRGGTGDPAHVWPTRRSRHSTAARPRPHRLPSSNRHGDRALDITARREATARRIAARLGVPFGCRLTRPGRKRGLIGAFAKQEDLRGTHGMPPPLAINQESYNDA